MCAPPDERTITPESNVVTVCDSLGAPGGRLSDSTAEVVAAESAEDAVEPLDSDVAAAPDFASAPAGGESEVSEDVPFDAGVPELGTEGCSSAQAVPGVAMTAPVTPSATASAPTPPMQFE